MTSAPRRGARARAACRCGRSRGRRRPTARGRSRAAARGAGPCPGGARCCGRAGHAVSLRRAGRGGEPHRSPGCGRRAAAGRRSAPRRRRAIAPSAPGRPPRLAMTSHQRPRDADRPHGQRHPAARAAVHATTTASPSCTRAKAWTSPVGEERPVATDARAPGAGGGGGRGAGRCGGGGGSSAPRPTGRGGGCRGRSPPSRPISSP
jgi:hypothetical protein